MINVSNCHKQVKQKSNIIHDYNESMFGIDRSEAILSFHSALRKMLRWDKKTGVYLLAVFLINALYLYRKFALLNKDVSHLFEFREVIIKGMICK